jgi:hypothetical protein
MYDGPSTKAAAQFSSFSANGFTQISDKLVITELRDVPSTSKIGKSDHPKITVTYDPPDQKVQVR